MDNIWPGIMLEPAAAPVYGYCGDAALDAGAATPNLRLVMPVVQWESMVSCQAPAVYRVWIRCSQAQNSASRCILDGRQIALQLVKNAALAGVQRCQGHCLHHQHGVQSQEAYLYACKAVQRVLLRLWRGGATASAAISQAHQQV